MTDDPRSFRQIQVLRELGLSRAEAEVYLSCLNLGAAGTGAFSSYRVAQDMGRDPANIGKIFSALIRLQAVRVVQEKPRLFAAVPPEEFTAHLVGRVRRHGAEAVTLLESFGSVVADGIAQALTSPAQAYARARDLLAAGRSDVLVSGSPEALRELGADLESAAQHSGCRVRVLTPAPMSSTVVDIGQVPPAGRVGLASGEQWLQLVVDGSSWLTALLQDEPDDPGPCGWWCRGSSVSRVLAEGLEVSWRSAVAVIATPPSAPPSAIVEVIPQELETEAANAFAAGITATSAMPAAAPAAAPAEVPAAARPAVPAPVPAVIPAATAAPEPPGDAAGPKSGPWSRPLSAEEADKAGFTFLFRHRGKPDRPQS